MVDSLKLTTNCDFIIADMDYVIADHPINFTPPAPSIAESTACASIQVHADAIYEGDETIIVTVADQGLPNSEQFDQ